jgi:ribosomal protein S18 acetylase RimI-like enzyme
MLKIIQCVTISDISSAKMVVKDYITWLGIDLSFQEIEKELSNFSNVYSPPDGIFLLAQINRKVVGGVGLKSFDERICEMKRLFVYDNFRCIGIGRTLCRSLINRAMNMRYAKMRLDTLERMKPAIKLYQSLGFKEIEPYRFNPDPNAIFMECNLKL